MHASFCPAVATCSVAAGVHVGSAVDAVAPAAILVAAPLRGFGIPSTAAFTHRFGSASALQSARAGCGCGRACGIRSGRCCHGRFGSASFRAALGCCRSTVDQHMHALLRRSSPHALRGRWCVCSINSGRCCLTLGAVASAATLAALLPGSFDVLSIVTCTNRYGSTLLTHSVAAGLLVTSALNAAASAATWVALSLRSLGVAPIATCTRRFGSAVLTQAWLLACLRHHL